MKYAWILRNKSQWPVSLQCEVLEVSPSGYHDHFARRATPRQRKHLSDDALLVHIKAIHAQSKGEYGWPRIWKTLLVKGIPVGKERVRKLMKLHGAYSGERDRSFRLNVTDAQCVLLRA